MTAVVAGLLIVAAALGAWMVHRTRRLRREAEAREARMLAALFAARHAAGGSAAAVIDGDGDGEHAEVSPEDIEAVLRAAGLPGERVVPTSREALPAAAPSAAGPVAEPGRTVLPPAALPAVRDLVQVFYEARGFCAAPPEPSAQPVQTILTHRTDASRSYAFVPLATDLSRDGTQPIIDAARRIGQRRVLIACEGRVPAPLADALLAQGIRAFDRASIDAQLGRIDAVIADRIRTGALRRSARRSGD